MDTGRLVFIDESGVDMAMMPACARAPRGQRALGRVPGGHWKRQASATAFCRPNTLRSHSMRQRMNFGLLRPDLNPTEPAWSKLKAVLQRAEARSLDQLDAELPRALATITTSDAQGWFRHAGYRSG